MLIQNSLLVLFSISFLCAGFCVLCAAASGLTKNSELGEMLAASIDGGQATKNSISGNSGKDEIGSLLASRKFKVGSVADIAFDKYSKSMDERVRLMLQIDCNAEEHFWEWQTSRPATVM
jgi:hypothetical protein